MPPDRGGERRAQEPEGLRAHGRERLQNALRDVDGEVDAQIAIRIGRAGRDRIERGDIPRLDDPELLRVDRPFDVLRPSAEMRFDPGADGRELAQAHVVEDVAAALEHRAGARVDEVVVRVHRAGDELLPETAHRVDRRTSAPPGDRVGREEDARDRRGDHALDHDRQAKRFFVDLARRAVRDRALVPERGPAAADRVEERVLAFDVEDRVLLTREARLGQILRRRRRAHRDGPAERAIRVAYRARDLRRHRFRGQACSRVAWIARIDIGGARRHVVGVGRDHEAVRHGEASADELAEVRAFATGDGDVARTERGQRSHDAHAHGVSSGILCRFSETR